MNLAQDLHGTTAAADAYTFRSMADHVAEVRSLLSADDPHWKAETVDLIIHNYMLLRRHGVELGEMNALFGRRPGRFREKITQAVHNRDCSK